jgi:MFS family permease
VWYTGQFYAQSFIENICKIEFEQSRTILIWAILFATPFFIVFGSLSDKIGRKWIMMGGMFLAIISYRPIYSYFMSATDVKTKTEIIEKRTENRKAVFNAATNDSTVTTITNTAYTDGTTMKVVKKETVSLVPVDKPAKPEIKTEKNVPNSTYWIFVLLVFVQILYVTMVYGPIAAFLVELFPTKIRYSSMSLPYHIGNGVFGGLVPFLGTLIVSFTMTEANPTGDPLAGLWYPIGIATLCLIIGVIFLNNKRDENVMD